MKCDAKRIPKLERRLSPVVTPLPSQVWLDKPNLHREGRRRTPEAQPRRAGGIPAQRVGCAPSRPIAELSLTVLSVLTDPRGDKQFWCANLCPAMQLRHALTAQPPVHEISLVEQLKTLRDR